MMPGDTILIWLWHLCLRFSAILIPQFLFGMPAQEMELEAPSSPSFLYLHQKGHVETQMLELVSFQQLSYLEMDVSIQN